MRSSNALRTAILVFAGTCAQAGVFVSITVAPPALPVYVQPVIPGEGYMWTPGYWAYGEEGYFWVSGVWVRPPSIGVLWTPGYWGWHGGVYAWNAGYWGPHVGFYGGVNYGFGFGGVGFAGGRWEGGHFAYNTALANVGGVSIHNSYHTTIVENNVHTSFNGGAGGLRSQPNAEERTAMNEHHVAPTAAQNSHHEAASHDHAQLASVNHGKPSNAAMSHPRAASAGSGTGHTSHAENSKASGGANKGGGGQSKGNNKPASKPAAHASKPAKGEKK